MKKIINKKNVIPFILGIVFTLVIIGGIIGIKKIFDNHKHNEDLKRINEENKINQAKEDERKTVVNGVTYIIDGEFPSNSECDAYNNVWFFSDDYFVTNDGKLYITNNKKYSDTNQNCKIYDEDIEVRSIFNDYSIITKDNKVYKMNYEYHGEDKEYKLYEDKEYLSYIRKELLNENIKYIKLYDSKEDYEKKTGYEEYLVLKNDGKLYKMRFNGIYNKNDGYFDYKFDKEEIYKEFDNEIIKRFSISIENGNGYIITDKSVYTQTPIDKKCLEYADIKCEYDFKENEFFKKYINNLKTIYFDISNFTIKTFDKEIYGYIENK